MKAVVDDATTARTKPAYTRHTHELQCRTCGSVWWQPDWYTNRRCPNRDKHKQAADPIRKERHEGQD